MEKLVLGIDLEGMNENLLENGVNLIKDRVTEIGAVIWDFEVNQPVEILSQLIDEEDHLPISKEVVELTGITDDMLEKWGKKGDDIKATLEHLANMMEKCKYMMAHNGKQYDLPMLREMFNRYGVNFPQKIWIDTYTDIEFPSKITNKSMAGLEHAHGFINPFPHRAVTDVLSMLRIASNYDIKRIGQMAESPIVVIVAKLDAPNWKNANQVEAFNKIKHKVSRARFRWNANNKVWTKEVQKILLDEDKINYDFDWYFQD